MKTWQNRQAMMLLSGDHAGNFWHTALSGFSGYSVCISYCQKPTKLTGKIYHLNLIVLEKCKLFCLDTVFAWVFYIKEGALEQKIKIQ